MGKMTSDFVALTVIFGGAGLGYGLTSLFAGRAPVAQLDEASVEVHVVPGRVMVEDVSFAPTIYFRSRARANRPDRQRWLIRGDVEDLRRDGQEMRGADLERLEAELGEELRRALKQLEGLEDLDLGQLLTDLDLGQLLTIDVLQRDEDEDQRRRRRRRRPRQEAVVPDASGN